MNLPVPAIIGGVRTQVIPSTANTDANGMVSAQIVLGNAPGFYTVGITVGSNTTAVEIQATGGAGG
jgi:hypothetical protein